MISDMDNGVWYFMLVRAVFLCAEVFYLLWKKGRQSDVLSNIACGAIIYIFLKLTGTGVVLALMYGVASFAPWELDFSWWLLGLTILGADLSFYIYHRTAHTFRIFWADHAVHHSSREYDFTTNLRGSFFSACYSWWPAIPLLLIGISPVMVMWCRTAVNDYTFFLHTQYVGKLGWFEKVFNTPSHHRVHHSCNSEYINKNFGFLLIIWDRMFGTFAEEQAPCVFGSRQTSTSKNPLKLMFAEWRRLLQALMMAQGWRNKLRLLGRMPTSAEALGQDIN